MKEKDNDLKVIQLSTMNIKRDALNHRKHRKSMSEIQRKIYNDKAAGRMKKYRERKRQLGLMEHIPLTRKKLLKQREYWRNKKREQRKKNEFSKEKKLRMKKEDKDMLLKNIHLILKRQLHLKMTV